MHRHWYLVVFIACSIHAQPTTQPISYREEVRENPAMRLYIVQVDLTNPCISVHVSKAGEDPDAAGPLQTTLMTTTQIARRENFAVAINASFFAPAKMKEILGRKTPYWIGNGALCIGWTIENGKLISNEPAPASIVVNPRGQVSIGKYAAAPQTAREMVSGMQLMVRGGELNTRGTGKDLAPRTGVGIDRAGEKLTLIVVDGRRPGYSQGMTLEEFGKEFLQLGCWSAMNLDGGGSSTMVMRSEDGKTFNLKNYPSDGNDLPFEVSVERPVASVLGIRLSDQPQDSPQ